MTIAAQKPENRRCLQSRVHVTDALDRDAATAPDSEIYASARCAMEYDGYANPQNRTNPASTGSITTSRSLT
jgi:hypothetical protein